MLITLAAIFILIFLYFFFNGKGIPSLLYHQINDGSNVNKKLLETHFEIIKNTNLKTFTISEAQEKVESEGKLPKNSLLITFDDGYYDNYLNVFPLLKKYNFKATFFLNTL